MKTESRRLSRYAALIGSLGIATPAWPQAAGNSVFVPVPPCRIVDTRLPSPGAPVDPAVPRSFDVVGSSDYSAQGGSATGCSIPGFAAPGIPTVVAVAVNVVAVNPTAKGNLLVFPTDVAPGTSSTVNFPPPSVPLNIANGVIVPVRVDSAGKDITVKTSQSTHVAIDVTGYFTTLPLRAELDTRGPSLVGGPSTNVIGASVYGATIAGGGGSGAGQQNRVSAGHFGTISGGLVNTVSNDNGAILGGIANSARGYASVIGGGSNNETGFPGSSVIESVETIAGGSGNGAIGQSPTICGGQNNTASTKGTVCGGFGSVATAAWSFAAGFRAGPDSRSFVWADSTDQDFAWPYQSTFTVRATGGVFFASGKNPATGQTVGVRLFPGSGSWSSVSDRALKRDIRDLDRRGLLENLASIPIREWRYATESPDIRHMGPTAQDFHRAFGLGRDDRHIEAIDADGIALAAIRELYAMARSDRRQIVNTRRELEARHRDEVTR